MTKMAFLTSMVAAATGIGLLIPASPAFWPYYSKLLVVHIGVSILLSFLLIWVMLTHVRRSMKHTHRGQVKRQTGLWYLGVILVTLGSGVYMTVRSGFAIPWILPLHLMTGIWCSVMGWKHSVKKKMKPLVKTKVEWENGTSA